MSLVCGDNFKLEIISSSKEHFDAALKICFDNSSPTATHYKIYEDLMILFYNDDYPGALELPYKMNYDMAKDFVWNWISNIVYPEYNNPGFTPGDDGDIDKGFKIYYSNDKNRIVSIRTEWILYGK